MPDIPSIITRPLPNAVTYDLAARDRVTITLPPRSTWSSGLHWHRDHDEYLRVVRGRIHVSLGGEKRIVGADEPEVRIPRCAWHSWSRADEDGEVVVVERTEPVDLQKAVFFWNLNGVVLDAPVLDAKLKRLPSWARHLLVDFWVTLSLFVIFHHLDNFPVFLNAPLLLQRFVPWPEGKGMVSQVSQKVDWLCTHSVLWLAAAVGRVFGVAPVQRRYTPACIYSQWCEDQHKSKKTS
ncbi:Cupin, RmlC-type [Cordyceps fumosorosea ARSEF 2679]|uniref:Cupin, RmlC-type n=1 Tax=Cordyceps fumosorosea (strain ARSEF 2679) TaxID=1081104 RepID=A0A162MDI4_CORFA|nr:Cupin, RmlC-type [Cordyceps fumosorosea ARSEF 2679]OAA54630.1 Cupin, RmlC-type [Cordyceps fumosorosea ARSEF 2679]